MFSHKNIKFISIAFLLIVVIFVSVRGADNPVKSGIFWLTSPFLKTFRVFSGGLHGFFQFLGSIGDLKNENEKLVKENLELVSEIAGLKDIKKENDLLRQQISLLSRGDHELEASFIIAEDNLGAASSKLMIDKGRINGIREGMPVVVSGNILVGKVSEVFNDTARISLIVDQDSAVNAEVLESGVKGIVEGNYGLGAMMNMISQTEVIKEGDSVISSGLGGGFPRGIFIGKIGQVGQSGDKLFQQASIISSVDLSSLRVVFVIKN